MAAREAVISDWVKGGPWHILALHFSICCKILQDVASFRWKLAKKNSVPECPSNCHDGNERKSQGSYAASCSLSGDEAV